VAEVEPLAIFAATEAGHPQYFVNPDRGYGSAGIGTPPHEFR
jgi:hypothetical protein